MSKYTYKINRRELSLKEKKDRVDFYNEMNPHNKINVEKFVARNIFDETVTFRCMMCNETIDFDLEQVEEEFPVDDNNIPCIGCQFCSDGIMIPDEVYETDE